MKRVVYVVSVCFTKTQDIWCAVGESGFYLYVISY